LAGPDPAVILKMSNEALVALSMGALGTLHCWGMCGGIVGAISLSAPAAVRADRRALMTYAAVYNLGRITSYTIGGALAGAAGRVITSGIPTELTFRTLQLLACLMLITAGLRLAGWLPQVALLERVGLRVWRHVQPLSRGLLPLDSHAKAAVLGLIWGWLPCGLVYSMFMTSATQADAGRGALSMAAFGLGTFPGMLAAAYALGRAPNVLKRPQVRRLAGALVVVIAIGWFARQWLAPAGAHAHHHHPAPAAVEHAPQPAPADPPAGGPSAAPDPHAHHHAE
jgi:hypothetical protein